VVGCIQNPDLPPTRFFKPFFFVCFRFRGVGLGVSLVGSSGWSCGRGELLLFWVGLAGGGGCFSARKFLFFPRGAVVGPRGCWGGGGFFFWGGERDLGVWVGGGGCRWGVGVVQGFGFFFFWWGRMVSWIEVFGGEVQRVLGALGDRNVLGFAGTLFCQG